MGHGFHSKLLVYLRVNWSYVSTIFLAIFCGDIPWNLGLKQALYMVGTSNKSVPEMAFWSYGPSYTRYKYEQNPIYKMFCLPHRNNQL